MKNEAAVREPDPVGLEGYDIADLITDETLEVEGVWYDFPRGARIKIARWNNEDFQKMMRRKFKNSRVILEQEDDVSDQVSKEILIEVMAHTILKDVENLAFQGKPVGKYNIAVGMQLLAVKGFRDKIRAYAEDNTRYLLKQEDGAVGN